MHLTVQALVLRVTPYKDTDAILTLLTGDHGMMTVKVRGLRRRNNPMTAACQFLAFGEFTLFEYRGNYSVNEAHAIELFQGLRRDLGKLSLGTYFAQAAEVLSQEDMPNPELLSLVLNCLYALDKLGKEELMVKSVFELRSASIAGYTPDLFGCHVCGSQEPVFLDISGGALLCEKCRGSTTGIRMPVSPAVLEAMRYIAYCDPKKLFAFEIGQESLQQLSSITEAFLTTQLERGFSTLDFYKSLFL